MVEDELWEIKFSAVEARDRVTKGLRYAFNGILYVLQAVRGDHIRAKSTIHSIALQEHISVSLN